ncbi:transcriptional regulator [Anaerocolumna cellulosilytica]|uniref:Transcriptional regulator n=1 Tax=Anaerocolumna cellulosilytica TaxID=433286 RepID=A0A6S6R304_9FIRM|nr:YafY family protein [Anaerocolumna cellulosilytica]MBB5196000.1 putative DNA-binding transcriptional regulator YafY [Anaerocolumna cellulosilytica]BCJ93700.1 transcriptional regulator [Anaerocolumna cellulosilytica]
MKLERMLAIVMLLLQRKKVTGKELSEMFEVSLRTIYRDIEAINAAGIPVITTSGIGGGIRIIDQYKIEKGIFTADDISTILMGLLVVQGALSGKDIATVQAKLRSFISEEQADAIEIKTEQIMFDLSSWIRGKEANRMIHTIKSAIEQKLTLTFAYLGHMGQEKLHGVEPHRLVFKNSQWYLQGYSTVKEDFRLFKLRRMYNLKSETDTFCRRILPHPFSAFTDIMSKKTFKIKLLIESSVIDRMLDYCTIDDITDLRNGSFMIDFNFIDDDYGYGILMSFGDKLTCLEPASVRAELQRRLQEMLARYNTDLL